MSRLLRRLYLAFAGRRQPKGGRHAATAPQPEATAPPTVDDAWAAITAANTQLDRRLNAVARRHAGGSEEVKPL